jgi:hypothetical protein
MNYYYLHNSHQFLHFFEMDDQCKWGFFLISIFTFYIKILESFSKTLAKLIKFTLEKQKTSKFSQFLCQNMAKFRPKKNRKH